MDGEFLCSRHHIAIDCGYLIIGSGSDDGQIAGEKDLTEVASSSVMSKTVNSFVICNRARTLPGEVEQLQFAALATHARERIHQFTQTGAVDVVDIAKIQ